VWRSGVPLTKKNGRNYLVYRKIITRNKGEDMWQGLETDTELPKEFQIRKIPGKRKKKD